MVENRRSQGIYECDCGRMPIHPGSCIVCAEYDIEVNPDACAEELAALRHLWERVSCYFRGDIWEWDAEQSRLAKKLGQMRCTGLEIGPDGLKGISHVQEVYKRWEK